jgi:hypothetical protein
VTSRFAGVTRWFLYLLIASIAIGAVLAIIIVLGGNWGWFESQVLLTTGVIAGASVLGMACAAASGRSGSLLPLVGVALAAIGAGLLIFGIWVGDLGDYYWRSTASVCIFAAAAAWASVVSLARLTPGHRWSQWLAGATAFVFAAMLVGIIFGEPSDDAIVRALAVVGILTAAFGLLVPVFHFLDRHAFATPAAEPMQPDSLEAIDAELADLRHRMAELEARRAALTTQG